MPALNDEHTRVIADIGGTNARIALFDEATGQYRKLEEYINSEHASLQHVLTTWLKSLDEPAPHRACIAAAAPPSGDQVCMTNAGWSFSLRELAQQFGFEELRCLNDFQANAYSLPYLGAPDRETIYAGAEDTKSDLAVMGPGTGLGGATLHRNFGQPVAHACEPGHAGLSPVNEFELEVFRLLLKQQPEIHAESVISGAGLVNLYSAVAQIHGQTIRTLEPAEVSNRALEEGDEVAVETLNLFCALLGSACGDFVVSNGTYGGLFIAGGIIPRMIGFLRQSPFLQRLQTKGAMSERLTALPVHVIIANHPGLIGAANTPL